MKILASNKSAGFEYFIQDTYECGIVLEGWEVKGILAGKISLNEAYVRVINEEIFLIGCNITSVGNNNKFINLDSTRTRKLLLHKHQIDKLIGKTQISGLTLIPIKMYYKDRRIKLEIALAKGKKLYDKRQDKKNRDVDREINKVMKQSSKYE